MTDSVTEAERRGDEEVAGSQRTWLQADVDGRPVRFWIVVGLLIAAVTLGFGAWWTYGLDRGGQMAGRSQIDSGGKAAGVPRVPPVFGYYDGRPISFIHTEVSDPAIAKLLERMMRSPVPVVPALAEAPDAALGKVYVFTNGVVPEDTPVGPLGYQPDVFDSAPGDEEQDYTPLREIVEVTWTDEAQARLLTNWWEIEAAGAVGEVTLERTGVVVNAPLLTWPGGER